MILPEGYELDFVVPSGSPEVFKNLIDYIDKEISLVVCGEDEAGRAEAGSRASSQVANTIRVVRASELSERLSHTLSQTLVRWIVDLNFGTDVAAPTLTREFRIEESPITVPDLSLLVQSGYVPRREWIERHFRVELEEKKEGEEEGEATQFDPEKDQDLFGSVFGDETGGGQGGEQAAAQEMEAAANVMDEPAGATPEESQADATTNPETEDVESLVARLMGEQPEESLFADEEEEEGKKKPFGDEEITEDEAVEMARE